jgi:hypothetical protein
MERKILRVSLKDRKKNEEIRHKTGMRDVLNKGNGEATSRDWTTRDGHIG